MGEIRKLFQGYSGKEGPWEGPWEGLAVAGNDVVGQLVKQGRAATKGPQRRVGVADHAMADPDGALESKERRIGELFVLAVGAAFPKLSLVACPVENVVGHLK